ncbi:MAG: helix-turn-helix transcriptional regulator, partial [Geodermatophilaceae bacterium]|nr:helix-turn-helix transcriptional regulator [Geodermatophilaceae bacterium]
AHPTRLALLEILAGEGSATATRCAELSGQSVASCSFHLRTLARFGFIEAVPGEGRQKPWRLASLRQQVAIDAGAGAGGDASKPAGDAFDEFFLRHEFARIRAWLQRRGEESEAWRRASLMSGAPAWLTPEELAEISAEVDALIERHFVRRLRDDGRRTHGGGKAGDGTAGHGTAGHGTDGRQPVRLFIASSVGLFTPLED